jgi:tRNA-specific 2-thiouridylase
MKNGADFVATGHYAQIKDTDGSAVLFAGVDEKKDQSYFLWNINKNYLKNILLPIGKYEKKSVREIAEKNKLPTAKKPDSQGLCFIGDVDLKSFLKNKLQLQKGKVLDINKKIIGHHDGAALYTVGERHGFHVETKNTNQEPLYVIEKDIENNTLTAGVKSQLDEITVDEVVLRNVNLLVEELPQKFEIAFRYQGKKYSTKIKSISKDELILKMDSEIKKPVEGQSAVFYKEGCCLGGGVV